MLFVKVQGTAASSKTTNSLLFRLVRCSCQSGQCRKRFPLLGPMMTWSNLGTLYVSMYTLKLRLGPQAQVPHALSLD